MSNIFNASLIVISLILFASCKKTDQYQQDRDLLHERFNGKYKIVSVKTTSAIDMNLDGKMSQDLIEEIPNIKNANLELRIVKDEKKDLFAMWWPEQYLDPEFDMNAPRIEYASQSYPFTFKYDERSKRIILDNSDISNQDAERYIVPKSINVLDDNTIKIKFEKKFYTSQGWQTIPIEVIYEKWTSVT